MRRGLFIEPLFWRGIKMIWCLVLITRLSWDLLSNKAMVLMTYNTLIILWNFNPQKTYLTRWRSYIVEDDAWIDGLYFINNKRNEYFQCSQTQFLDRLRSRWRIQSPFLYQREVGPFVLFHKEECWKNALM